MGVPDYARTTAIPEQELLVLACESDLEVKGGWALSKSAALVWGIESAFLRKFPGDTAASGQGTHLENH